MMWNLPVFIFICFLLFITGPKVLAGTDGFFLVSQEMEQGLAGWDLKKIWFKEDLGQAVFLRKKSARTSGDLLKQEITFIDEKIAHLDGAVYFYNLSKDEIHSWVKANLNEITSPETTSFEKAIQWSFNLIVPSACAANENCETKQKPIEEGYFKKFTNFVSGETLSRMIGCSGDDPKFKEDKPASLSPKAFGAFVKESWEQLKGIISSIPHMEIPQDLKKQLTCDAFMVGIMIPQNMLLGSTGVGAPIAIVRMYAAVKRLLGSVKYLKRLKKAPVVAMSKTERIYETQRKMAKNMQDGVRQILDKGRMTDPKYNQKYFWELKEWVIAEQKMQKDLLVTAKKLNRTADVKDIEKRIKTLDNLTKRDGALSKIEKDDFPLPSSASKRKAVSKKRIDNGDTDLLTTVPATRKPVYGKGDTEGVTTVPATRRGVDTKAATEAFPSSGIKKGKETDLEGDEAGFTTLFKDF